MQLVQLPTRQELLSSTTCADTLPASDPINAHRPTNQSFLPTLSAANLASRIVLVRRCVCNGNGGLLQAHILSLTSYTVFA